MSLNKRNSEELICEICGNIIEYGTDRICDKCGKIVCWECYQTYNSSDCDNCNKEVCNESCGTVINILCLDCYEEKQFELEYFLNEETTC